MVTKPAQSAVYSRADVRRETGYSDTSLDRLEADGVVAPLRTPGGRRVYRDCDIEALRSHRDRSAATPRMR
jgi:DNA-binding transcriptional MerR regulator